MRANNQILSVEVVGAGGAFDADITNSSFFMRTNFFGSTGILYDCGYNVFPKLMRDHSDAGDSIIGNTDWLIISHDDDDHCGSAKSLLYFRYFVLGKTTNVICQPHMMHIFEKMNLKMLGSEYLKANIVKVYSYDEFSDQIVPGISIHFFNGVHHTPSFGIILSDNSSIVAISGDTKATARFEYMVTQIQENDMIDNDKTLVFHDYSYWDAPSRQVHACKSDFDVEYTKEFRDRIYKYHNSVCGLEDTKFDLRHKEIKVTYGSKYNHKANTKEDA